MAASKARVGVNGTFCKGPGNTFGLCGPSGTFGVCEHCRVVWRCAKPDVAVNMAPWYWGTKTMDEAMEWCAAHEALVHVAPDLESVSL